MIGFHKLTTILSTFILKAKHNPDFAAAVFIGYGLMAFQVVIQILLVPLYLKTFGAYRFGALMSLISFAGLAFALVGALYTVMLRLFGEAINAKDEIKLSALYFVAKIISICIGLLCSIIFVAVEVIHPVLFDDAPVEIHHEIFRALQLSIVHLLLLCELSVEQTMLAAKGRQAAANLVTLMGLVVFAITVVPVLILDGALIDVMACFIVADIFSRIFAYYLLRRYVHLRLIAPLRRYGLALREILSSQAQKYFILTGATVVLQADVLIVATIGSPLDAAKFVLVWKIAEMLTLLLSRVTQHLQVEFVRMDLGGERKRLIRIYRQVYGALFIASLCLAGAYGLFGHWIVAHWVGEDTVPGETWAYGLAGLTILWIGIARLPITLMLSLNQITPLVKIAGLELSTKLLLIFLLYPEWGYLSPIIAISATHFFGIAYGYYILGRSTLAQSDNATT